MEVYNGPWGHYMVYTCQYRLCILADSYFGGTPFADVVYRASLMYLGHVLGCHCDEIIQQYLVPNVAVPLTNLDMIL